MNVPLLLRAVETARTQPYSLDMLTTWEVIGLSERQERTLTIGVLKTYFSKGMLRCDIATIIAMLIAPNALPATPFVIQDTVMKAARLRFQQYETLIYFPLWPAKYREPYRTLRKTILYEAQIEIISQFVTEFTQQEQEKHGQTEVR